MPRLKPKPPRLWQMAKLWPGLQNSADGWRERGLSMMQKHKLLPRWLTLIVPVLLLSACARNLPVYVPPPEIPPLPAEARASLVPIPSVCSSTCSIGWAELVEQSANSPMNRSAEHTSTLQSLKRISYAVF